MQRSTATVILLFPTPVAQNKTMEANHQAVTNVGLQISWPIPERLPTLHSWLAQDLHMISVAGPQLKGLPPFPHSKVDCPGPKGLSVKTGKQLAVETLRDQQCIKVTLMLVASCPHRRKHLTSFRFLPFIQVLTWKCR